MPFTIARFLVLIAFTSLASVPGIASERAAGSFTATRACDAYQSFRNRTNPGQVKTTPGTAYEVTEVNSRNWEWIRIQIPGASDSARWVSRDCGTASLGPATENAARAGKECNAKTCMTVTCSR